MTPLHPVRAAAALAQLGDEENSTPRSRLGVSKLLHSSGPVGWGECGKFGTHCTAVNAANAAGAVLKKKEPAKGEARAQKSLGRDGLHTGRRRKTKCNPSARIRIRARGIKLGAGHSLRRTMWPRPLDRGQTGSAPGGSARGRVEQDAGLGCGAHPSACDEVGIET